MLRLGIKLLLLFNKVLQINIAADFFLFISLKVEWKGLMNEKYYSPTHVWDSLLTTALTAAITQPVHHITPVSREACTGAEVETYNQTNVVSLSYL